MHVIVDKLSVNKVSHNFSNDIDSEVTRTYCQKISGYHQEISYWLDLGACPVEGCGRGVAVREVILES